MKNLLLTITFLACVFGLYAQAPTISSFSPSSGAVGITVNITGTGFSSTLANNVVIFGATRATVTAATATQLTVTVPTGATYAPITVLNTATGLLAYSKSNFTPTFSPNKGSITTEDFTPKVDFTAGTNPQFVAVGDLDGDGKADLTVANRSSNTVSIYRNTTSSGSITTASFAAKVDFATGSGPFSVAIGDLDGDGKADLAVANVSTNTVSLFRNTSSSGSITTASFAAKVDFTAGPGAYSVAIGDLDGDGKADLAVGNYGGSGTVSVYRNTSSSGSITTASFAPKVDFATGSGPLSLSIGDLDGDGKADLVTNNNAGNTVSVLRNTSSSGSITTASFAPKVDFTTGSNPYSVSIGDLDGDGKADLAVANYGSNTVSVHRNTSSSGSITSASFAPKVDFTTGIQPYSVAVGDLDGDGKADLVVPNSGGNTVSVFRNTSSSGSITTSSFAPKVDLTSGSGPSSLAVGDLDGDAKADLAVANPGSNTVSVIRNNPVYPPPTIATFSPASGAVGATVTITGTNFDPTPANNVVIFGATRATVTAATATQLTVTVPTGATYAPITVLNTTTSLLAYSNSNFTPTFSPTKGSITTADFSPKVDFAAGTDQFSVATGDLDSDGKVDLVVANRSSNTVSVYRNTSSSGSITTSSFAPKVDFVTGASPVSVSIGDLDGDGKPDLAVANNVSNTVSVLRNTSSSGSITTASFASKVDFTTGGSPFSVTIGDLDGDGKADLAVANRSSNMVSIYRNTSSSGSINTGSFATKVDFTTGIDPYSVAIGDLDSDGKADLAVVNLEGNTVSVFRNTSSSGSITTASFAAKVDFATGAGPASLAIGDLDGDGKADLALANSRSDTFSVFRNISSSGSITTASFAAKVDFITGTGSGSLAIADLDGDGKADLAVANFDSNTASVFRNTSSSGSITTASFANKVDFTTGAIPVSLAIADLDGDGKADLAVANFDSNTVSVIRNSPIISAPPTIATFSPSSGVVGTTVTISGTNFSTTPASNVVRFNGVNATVTAASATSITTAVPANATTGKVTVTVDGQTATSASNFTVILPPPTITSFSPASGTVGTTITITGTNFDPNAFNNTVTVNGVAATRYSNSTTSITIKVPAGATTGKIAIAVNGQNTTSATDFAVITIPGQWVEKNNGLFGGDISQLASEGANLVAGNSSRLYFSSNNGIAWTKINFNRFTNAVAMGGGKIYAGTSTGLYVSDDNGTNWALNAGLTNSVFRLLVSGANLFAVTSTGVSLSTNNGTSWSLLNSGLSGNTISTLATNGTDLYAGTNSGGVFVSSNNGTGSWASISTGLPSQRINSVIFNNGNLFAAISGTGGGLFASTNGGTSWSQVSSSTGLNDTFVTSLAKIGTTLFASTNTGVFVSTNNGTTWTVSRAGMPTNGTQILASSGPNLFAGTYFSGGVYLSTDNGANWVERNNGLTSLPVNNVTAVGNTIWGSALSKGVFVSSDEGASWSTSNNGITGFSNVALYQRCFIVSGSNYFIGGWGVFRSANNGASWTDVNSSWTKPYVNSFAVNGSNLFAGTQSGVFLSTNDGTNWTAVNTGLTNTFVRSLAISGSNLFAGTNGGVFLSTNNGSSWTAVNTGLSNTTYVYSLLASGSNLFAGTDNGAFISTDNGTSWKAVNTGLPDYTTVLALAKNGSNLYAGTYDGVFLSTNNGESWTDLGFSSGSVNSITFTGTNLYAGTGNSGVWSRPLSDLVVPPTISSFAPGSGTAGTAVTISGNNFDLTPANNSVTINGVAATVTASTGTTLTVTVPTGATTGKIAVTVNGQTTTSTTDFTFITLPGQWVEKNNGLYGGAVNELVANGSNLYAGTGGGVFLSTNNGASWTPMSSGLINPYVNALAVSGGNLYAGTSGGGVFLSTNNGGSWTAVNTGLTNTTVWSLAVSGSNLYAGTSGGGVFLSTNNGGSWTAVNTGLTNTTVWSLAVSGSNLYAGTSGGVFLSTDNGVSWATVNSGLSNTLVNALAVSGSNLYAGTGGGGVFLSTNNGASWTSVKAGLTNTTVFSLAVSGSNLYAGTANGVFLSANNGTSWSAANSGLTSSTFIRALAVNGGSLFAGTTAGVSISNDSGANWADANNGLTSIHAYAMIANGGKLFVGGPGSSSVAGQFLSSDNGASWTEANLTGGTGVIENYTSSGNSLFAATLGGVFLSTNGGANWAAINNGLTNSQVWSIAAVGNTIYSGTRGGGVFISSNNGTSWAASNSGLTFNSNTIIFTIAGSGGNIFAGTNGSGLFRSTDGGATWAAANSGLTNSTIRSLIFSGSNIFAGTGGGIFLSTDNGDSWIASSVGLPANTTVYNFSMNGSNLFTATSNGVYVSTNNGGTWSAINTGLPTNVIYSLQVNSNNLFAGTDGRGVWSRPLSDFNPAPTITSFTPTSGAVGAPVTITGTNFDLTPANNVVKFNGTTAVVTASTASSITTTVPTGATTGPITVTVGGQTATSAGNFTAGKTAQTITFATLAAKTFGDAAFTLASTASSQLPVSYTSGNLAVATVSGNTVTIVGTGTTTITASQAGDATFDAAVDVPQTLTVNKAAQTITFAALAAKTFGDAAFTLAATSSSSLAVTYASSNTAVATVTGNTVTIVGAGTTTITASQVGNSNYNGATDVPQTLTVNKAAQTITFAALAAKTFGDAAFALSSTASSGLPVTYASSNTAVATVSGNTITIVGGGTATITASQAGNGNYNAATDVPQTLTVNKAAQSITFAALAAKTFGDAAFALSSTASSGLPVTYASSNTAVATVSGNTITIVGGGTSTITASQAGNSNYNAATDVPQTLTVNKAAQTITFAALAAKTFGDAAFALSSTASSGLPVTYASSNTAVATVSGNTITIVGGGTATITASQAGNSNYNAATDVPQTLTVNKATQTITFAALAPKTFGNAAFTLAATASSGLAVTYASGNTAVATVSGNTITIVGAGSTSITASQLGNASYNAATEVIQALTVNKANQTITFAAFPSKSYGDAPFTISATASSNLPVTLANGNPLVATLAGNTITIVGAGNSLISGSQAGNANFNAAPNATQLLKIKGNFVSDSLALVRLYNNTNGAGWTNKTNWLSTTIDKWFGVTLSGQGVAAVNLPNNKLTGPVPEGIAFMQALKTLNLSGNAITSIPDFSDNQVITALNVSNNKLEFGSLEPNKSLVGATVAFNYTNQADIGTPASSLVDFGTDQTVTAQTGGTNNYVWKRNGVIVANADAKSYVIKAIGRANMGEYVCEVTNPSIPGLTIKTAPNKILATALLSGKLFATTGNAANKGIMKLLKKTTVGGYDTVATKAINTDGAYKLEKVVLDDYQLNGFVDTLTYKGALPTWFTNTIYWEEANIIAVEGNVDNLNITSNYKPVSPPKGKGIIKGTVFDLDNSGRLDKQKRVAGCGASVRRVENVGRTEAEKLTLVAYVFSNENGEFTLPELPTGDYRLNIQYPGYPMDVNSFINISIAEGLKSLVVVAAEVDKGQIKVKKLIVTGDIDRDEYAADVFPNPSADYIQLRFNTSSEARTVRLTDLTGKVITLQPAPAVESKIDVTALSAGIYLLELKEKDQVVKTLRVMKE
jgi:photosystem II stability/assembly factor-like uncharacterized protein